MHIGEELSFPLGKIHLFKRRAIRRSGIQHKGIEFHARIIQTILDPVDRFLLRDVRLQHIDLHRMIFPQRGGEVRGGCFVGVICQQQVIPCLGQTYGYRSPDPFCPTCNQCLFCHCYFAFLDAVFFGAIFSAAAGATSIVFTETGFAFRSSCKCFSYES